MTEKLLQYIWQFQYFNRAALQSTDGESIDIIFPGQLNTNQGPDFINARIKIGKTILVGSVELHLKTSGWIDHGHDSDQNFKNVILHVVLVHDVPMDQIPVFELQPRISKVMLQRYEALMYSNTFIACANSIKEVKSIVWLSWKERLLAERLTRKSAMIFQFLKDNNGHWEETMWWMLARNFGIKVNADAFEAIARSISINILAKHKNQIHHLEGMLLGQAGLLNKDFEEDYPNLLKREYTFLAKKFNLKPIHQPVHFLRMRPGNFPSLRLAQLAALIQNASHMFSKVIEAQEVKEIKSLLDVVANDFWHYHYRLDEHSAFKKKPIGKDMIDNILINTMVPMVFAYACHHNDEQQKSKALRWLEELEPEQNHITKGFKILNIINSSAFDSQALIELKTQYCDQKRCLECAVGNAILKSRDV